MTKERSHTFTTLESPNASTYGTIVADDGLKGFEVRTAGNATYWTAQDARDEIARLMAVKNPAGPGAQYKMALLRKGLELLEAGAA